MSRRLRVAVDTGGTFTDFVVLDEASGALDVFKVPSTRGSEADGIVGGLRGFLERTGAQGSDVVYFSHGTTVGTNAILEENGARTGLLGAFTLATGRALGETVAVALVIGNSPYIAHSIKSPAATIPSLIVNNFGEATGTELAVLFGAGLVLLVIGIAVNSVARWLVWSTAGPSAGATAR